MALSREEYCQLKIEECLRIGRPDWAKAWEALKQKEEEEQNETVRPSRAV